MKGETLGSSRNSRRGRGRTRTFDAKLLGAVADSDFADKAVVKQVQPESPAAKAGLQKGDIVLGYKTRSGRLRKMRNSAGLRRRIVGFGPGDKLTLSVQRGEKTLDLEVKLPEAK